MINFNKTTLKKPRFGAIFTGYYMAERSASWPKLSASFAENFGRIFGFGRTLLKIIIRMTLFQVY